MDIRKLLFFYFQGRSSMKKLLPLLFFGFLSIIIGASILSKENKETSPNRDISQMSDAHLLSDTGTLLESYHCSFCILLSRIFLACFFSMLSSGFLFFLFRLWIFFLIFHIFRTVLPGFFSL